MDDRRLTLFGTLERLSRRAVLVLALATLAVGQSGSPAEAMQAMQGRILFCQWYQVGWEGGYYWYVYQCFHETCGWDFPYWWASGYGYYYNPDYFPDWCLD